MDKPALEGGQKTRSDFLVFSKPHFGEEEAQEIIATLRSGWVGTGPRATQLEKEFAAYVGAKHAVAMNSCTAALHIAMACLDLRDGDEVIVPALTFGATANAVVHAGGTPVFVDVDAERLALDVALVEKALTSRTRAVVLVHFAGRLGPASALAELCRARGLELIEDCAHAIETTDGSHQHAGTFGMAGCFSFYANKNMSTAEGGMLVTNNSQLAERARKLSLHGMSKDAHKRFSSSGYTHYEFEEFGFKYNMPDLAAALGLHQLRRIEENAKLRRRLWDRYMTGLKSLPLGLPTMPEASSHETHALHLFQIRVDDKLRDTVLSAYGTEGIGVGVHYRALVDHPLYQRFLKGRSNLEDFAVARSFGRQTISLPLGTAMNEKDVDDTVAATKKLLRYYLEAGPRTDT